MIKHFIINRQYLATYSSMSLYLEHKVTLLFHFLIHLKMNVQMCLDPAIAVTERRGHITEMCLSLIKIYIYIYAYKQCNNKITIKRPGWIRRLWGDIRAALQHLRGPTRKMVKDPLSGTVMVLNKIRLDLDLI